MENSQSRLVKSPLLESLPYPNRGLFLDADGTLWPDEGFGAFNLIPRIHDRTKIVLASLRRHFRCIVIVTNQTGAARGHVSQSKVEKNMKDFLKLPSNSTLFDAIAACLHHPDATLKKFRYNCKCRKPNSELLQIAFSRLGVSASESFLVGDRITDAICGSGAGIKNNYLIHSQNLFKLNQMSDKPEIYRANFKLINNLLDLEFLLEGKKLWTY